MSVREAEAAESIGTYRDLRVTPFHVGVIAIPAATIVAMNLVPSASSTPGALFWSAWVMTAGLLAGAVWDVVHDGVSKALQIPHVVMLGMIMIVFAELLQSTYVSLLDTEIVRQNFMAIGVFGTSFAAGACLRPPRLPRVLTDLAKRDYSVELTGRIMIACWLIAMFNYVASANFSPRAIYDGLLASRFSAPWNRGQLGGWNAFLDFLSNFGYVVPPFTVILALRKKSWLNSWVITGLACSIIFLAFVAQGGGRRQVIVIIGAAALTWFCAHMHRLTFRHYLAAAVLVVVTGLISDLVLEQRTVGFGDFQYSADQFNDIQVDNNFQSIGETMAAIPKHVDFVGFRWVYYVLVRPIPRILWPGKPVDGGFDLASYLGYKDVAFSVTAIGEAYMSFGWWGITVAGVVFGFLGRFWSQLSNHNSLTGYVLYSLGAMTLMIGTRSFLELILVAYPIFCWMLLDRIFRHVEQRRTQELAKAQG
jgi:hypothetical protein